MAIKQVPMAAGWQEIFPLATLNGKVIYYDRTDFERLRKMGVSITTQEAIAKGYLSVIHEMAAKYCTSEEQLRIFFQTIETAMANYESHHVIYYEAGHWYAKPVGG